MHTPHDIRPSVGTRWLKRNGTQDPVAIPRDQAGLAGHTRHDPRARAADARPGDEGKVGLRDVSHVVNSVFLGSKTEPIAKASLGMIHEGADCS
jgi:hypothetical protein